MKISNHQTLPHLLPCILFGLLLLNNSVCHSTIITDLVISEIMANPSSVSDANGEWFELYNPSNNAFDLNGTTLSDNSTTGHQINDSGDLFIQPGEYFVLGRNGNEITNGGYQADYIYSSFNLTNTDDEIILTDTIGNILKLEYEKGFIENGQSLELITTEMLLTNYIAATLTYGNGDKGTPGTGPLQQNTIGVPEPSTALLLLSGIVMMRALNKRQSLAVSC